MDNGWIKIHRSILSWEWWDDRNTRDLFIYCLLMANHEDRKWHGKTIGRGSFVTSLQNLAVGSGLTVQNVRTSLERLKSTHELTSQSTSGFTTITICKYEQYQMFDRDDQQANQQAFQQTDNKQLTNEQQTTNKQLTTNKNIKNVRIEECKNNISSSSPARAREEELALGGVIGEVDSLAEELKEEIQNGGSTAESALRLYGLNPQQQVEYLGWFVDKLRLDGTTFKSRSDFRRHFANWLRIQVEQSLKRQQSNGTKYSSRNENPADLFTELG